MKLNKNIKRMVLSNLNEISIFDLKYIIEFFGAAAGDRFLAIIYRINKSRGLILIDRYPTYTKFSSNYYNNTTSYDFNESIGFYIRYRF